MVQYDISYGCKINKLVEDEQHSFKIGMIKVSGDDEYGMWMGVLQTICSIMQLSKF